MNRLLRKKRLFLFDLDGVFYKGKETRVKIGGTVAVEALRAQRRKLFVLTNNSTDTAETVHQRLLDFQIPGKKEEVLTSAQTTAQYIRERHGRVAYFLVGEAGLDSEMKREGHRRVEGEGADCVVIGLDRGVTYDVLDQAARLARGGAEIVATHDSALFMYKTGPAMAAGPLVRAVEYASGKRATVVGKPSPLMFRMALKKAGCKKGEAVMIGDQLDTDITGALRAGIDPILVTSGIDKSASGYRLLAKLSNVDEIVPML